jgi:hypothetical protein
MATTTQPQTETATAPSISPKLIQCVKQIVAAKGKFEMEQGKRLITLESLLREEKVTGLAAGRNPKLLKSALRLAMQENGLDDPTISKLLSIVFSEHESDILAANAHNAAQDGKRTGLTIGFDEKRKIASGETTFAELLQAKTNPMPKPEAGSNNANKGQGKVDADKAEIEDAAKAKALAEAEAKAKAEIEAMTPVKARAAIVRVLEALEASGVEPEACAEIGNEAITLFMEDAETTEETEASES